MRIALVHGAWADGSSWAAVVCRLQSAGHDVIASQFSHTSLADNVAKLRHVLSLDAEPTVVAGHSYGGSPSPSATRSSRRTPRGSSRGGWARRPSWWTRATS